MYRVLLGYGATVDKNNNPLGNVGAWSEFQKVLISEGVVIGMPQYADAVGDEEIPPAMAAKLGIKQGTTFAQQWPGRFAAI